MGEQARQYLDRKMKDLLGEIKGRRMNYSAGGPLSKLVDQFETLIRFGERLGIDTLIYKTQFEEDRQIQKTSVLR